MLHDCKKGERERERVDVEAPSCSDWQKSAARNPEHTRSSSPLSPSSIPIPESNLDGAELDEPRDRCGRAGG